MKLERDQEMSSGFPQEREKLTPQDRRIQRTIFLSVERREGTRAQEETQLVHPSSALAAKREAGEASPR